MANIPFETTEIQLDEDVTDPTIVGGLKNVNGILKGRDEDGVYDLRLGGGSYLTINVGKNQNPVTPGTYLATVDGGSTHPRAAAPSIPYKATLTAATMAVDVDVEPGVAWAMEILVNNVLKVTLVQPDGSLTSFATDSLSVDVEPTDRISIRNANSGSVNLALPICSLAFRLRK